MKISIVLPVYNEAEILKENIEKLHSFMQETLKYEYKIIIGDNGSCDNTQNIVKQLTEKYENISYFHLDKKGRGLVLKKIWNDCDSDIVSYIDADISADLSVFPALIDYIVNGYDIAIGSRLIDGVLTKRGLFRHVLSKIYNRFVKIFLSVKDFSDAQCGFKALRTDIAKRLIPNIKNDNWFFDTELLYLCEKERYKIKEIAVSWTERRPSKVKLFKAACEDLLGLIRLRTNTKKELK